MPNQPPCGVSNSVDRERHYILLVDIDTNDAFYVSTILHRFDYLISIKNSSQDALSMISTALPALIIVGQYLKDMPGLVFLKHLKKTPKLAKIPVIGIALPGDLPAEKDFLSLGAANCLFQPIAPDLLLQTVKKTMETEPRRKTRIRTYLPVKVNEDSVECPESICVTDISEVGMFIRTSRPQQANTTLSVEINLRGLKVRIKAAVVYSFSTGSDPYHVPGMGLEFVEISPRDQDLIREFIRSEVTPH